MDFELPNPIGDFDTFAWGPVVRVHCIGPYAIVEYHPKVINRGWACQKYDRSTTRFHVYYEDKEWQNSYESFYTLDAALIGCVTIRKHGRAKARNEHFVSHVLRLLHLDTDEAT